jgi:hypothetical protein
MPGSRVAGVTLIHEPRSFFVAPFTNACAVFIYGRYGQKRKWRPAAARSRTAAPTPMMKVFALLSLVAPALCGTMSHYGNADCSGTPSSTDSVDPSGISAATGMCVSTLSIGCVGGIVRYNYHATGDTTCTTAPTQTCAAASMLPGAGFSMLGANCYLEFPPNVCVIAWNATIFGTARIIAAMLETAVVYCSGHCCSMRTDLTCSVRSHLSRLRYCLSRVCFSLLYTV